MTITPVESRPGCITHFIAINQDISERKLAQQRADYLATTTPYRAADRMLLCDH